MSTKFASLLQWAFRFWLVFACIVVAGLFVVYQAFSPSGLEMSLEKMPVVEAPSAQSIEPVSIPSFDSEHAEYLLTVTNRTGIQEIMRVDGRLDISGAGNILVAQLIKRGQAPEVETDKVRISYEVDPKMRLLPGNVASGNFIPADDGVSFVSPLINVLPYTSEGEFMPYSVVTVAAQDADGNILAKTATVLPVSTEIGCHNCHTGTWENGATGLSKQTADNILAVHDRRNGTDFVYRVSRGETINCHSCHGSFAGVMSLSTAMHGFHAAMDLQGADACGNCHASASTGQTQFQRDVHASWGVDCIRCHGELVDHAISLLRYETEQGNSAAQTRMLTLKPVAFKSYEEIVPRKAWVNLPDCTGCHDFSQKPDPTESSAFNKWTKDVASLFGNRLDDSGQLRCLSCHGSPHAVYPAVSPLGDDRDNLQPMQYQGVAAPLGAQGHCAVCHMDPMDMPPIHHTMIE